MGSSCSSGQKKKDKEKNAQGQSPMDDGRRRSTDSIPYGKGSPPSSRRPSFDPNSAPAPLAEQVESPETSESIITKTPVAAALSQASTVGGGSCSSPPLSGGLMGTPLAKDAPSLDAIGLPDLQLFPERTRYLILGRISELEPDLLPQLQEIMLYISADHYDSARERDFLAERVFPELRKYTALKGYDLNVADLHWGLPGVAIADHSLRDLCIGTLEHWRKRRRLLTLIVFNDNIGVPLMPRTMPKPHFEAALEAMTSDEDRELFHKWYALDENAALSSFALKSCIDMMTNKDQAEEERSEILDQWKGDANKMLQILRQVLPDGQKTKYLNSVLEDEINVLVGDDPQESKRVLWMQRRFTHAKPSDKPNPDIRRVDRAKVRLEDYLPDTQKLVSYVKWHEGDYDVDADEEDARYMNEVCDTVRDELTKMIDAVLEEDFVDEAQRFYRGIESNLHAELIQQYSKCRTLSENFLGRAGTLQSIKAYVEGSTGHPIVIHGPSGCGKSHLVARCSADCSSWLPTAPVVVRFVGLTSESATHEQLLRSILEQCCALYGEHPVVASESVQDWGSGLERLLEKVSESRPLVVMIDGLDQVSSYASSCSKKNFHWLPKDLPPHVKLVLTVSDDSDELRQMKEILNDDDCFMPMDNFTKEEGFSTIEKALKNRKRLLPAPQKSLLESCLQEEPNSRYCELLREMTLDWPAFLQPDTTSIEKNTESIMTQRLTHAELYLGRSLLTFVLGILVSVKHGVTDSEMLDLLSCEESVINLVFDEKELHVRRFPAVVWVFCKKLLGTFISSQILGGRTLITMSSSSYRTAVLKYLEAREHNIQQSAQTLADYFFGKWAEDKKPKSGDDMDTAQDRFVLYQPLAYGPNPNRRKLDELPYQVLHVDDSIRENFLFDATWLLYKSCGSDPYQLLEDIAGYENKSDSGDEETKLLTWVIQLSSYPLRCDGSQFFAQMYGRLNKLFLDDDDAVKKYPSMSAIFDTARKPPLSSLLPIGPCLKEPALGVDPPVVVNCVSESPPSTPLLKKSSPFSGFYTIKGDVAHIVSLSCEKGEIIVWNIYEQLAVRKLVGINQPKDIKMIDQYRALVLCNRELKVYHLDQGTLLVKLKGVMNQKMAYYGLHDENYAVSLSRNRMYVNMTNLTTGDLETTFKVGEDRFLNSLLVSANGRICVCGDETQKPFPLLVWDLSSRKLVYDLRIPHHEFVTRLSAISDDGHYVVSVCRELHDTSPNFIIVYDLQSGTLFKKWKPESSSCSIAISSQGMCVVNGLENTWVLVWDLSTGARRFTLRGHSAPVDQIRIEEEGHRCLTYDSRGRDRSLRVWDVTKGECLAVFTPDEEFSCCELSLDGRAVVLGLANRESLTTLVLCRETTVEEATPELVVYGDEDKKGQTFDMSRETQ